MSSRGREGLCDETLSARGVARSDATGAERQDLFERADVGSFARQACGRRKRDIADDVAHRHAQRSRAGSVATARQRPDDLADRRQLVPERQDSRDVSRASETEAEPGEWTGAVEIRD